MSIRITLRRQTVKALEAAWQSAYQRGEKRVVRRISALLSVLDGVSLEEVAARLGLGRATLYGWVRAFVVDGLASLRYRRAPGRPAKLTPAQKKQVCEWIAAGPEALGFRTGCWNSSLVQQLIEREFGCLYHVHYVSQLLRSLGLSYQKARFVSDHLNEAQRATWRTQTWPTLLHQARAAGALLLFGDEASFAQWGSLGYTWAPKGSQPLVKTTGKRKAYKVFGLTDYFSGRLFWHGHTERFTSTSYCAFLTPVLAVTTQPLFLIQDGARYHTSAATRAFFAALAERLHVFQLPAYSPDYNPIEHLWRNLKRARTHNRYFATFDDLSGAVEDALATFHHDPLAVKQRLGSHLAEAIGLPLAA